MAYLALVRHGLSEWNAKGWWTGWNNPPLTPQGHIEGQKAGEALKDISFDEAYVSDLLRAQQTLDEIKKALGKENMPTTIAPQIKERNYGDLAGKNKWEMKEKYGEEQFMKWRRSWDSPIPNGETLKDVYNRAIPYYESTILPRLKEGKNIILASSGNPLRAFVKYMENISEQEITSYEIGTGEVYVYEIDTEGRVVKKEIRSVNPDKLKV
jgi:2,3-bisphosphoglycerate-dependent phosphoglycerate mutase